MSTKLQSMGVALAAGVLFGFGLALSEMLNPARVIGFLDVAGQWDPTLALVMGGALLVTFPLFPRVLRHAKPRWGERFVLPTKVKPDIPLVVGAVLFGMGWGVAGFCPGPAIAALASGLSTVLMFVLAMLAGQLLVVYWPKR